MIDIKAFNTKDLLAYAAVMAMCLGFLISRSMYSFGLLFMGLYWVTNIKASAFLWKHPVFISTILISLIAPLSDLFNNENISQVFFIKLSLPLFIVFFFTWQPNRIKLRIINHILILSLFVASIIALFQYYLNFDGTNKEYVTAKVMRIGYYSDHIRISIAIALSVIIAQFEMAGSKNRIHKLALMFIMCFQTVFLHILSARSGLIVLYITLTILLILFLVKSHKKITLAALISLILLPIISFKVFPSFYHRIGYSLYDLNFYKNMEYRQGSSDGFRFYSMKAGIEIGQNHPIIGVGFSKLPDMAEVWFKTKFPNILDSEIIQPSSEYILYFAAGGLVGLAIFIFFAFSPYFFIKERKNIYFISIYTGLFVTFLFEILLENQYGLFVYGYFFALVWWIAYSSQQHLNGIDQKLN